MFDFFRDLLSRKEDVAWGSNAERMLNAYKRQVSDQDVWIQNEQGVASIEAGQLILHASPEERAHILTIAFVDLCRTGGVGWGSAKYWRKEALLRLVSRLLRARLPLRPDELGRMLNATSHLRSLGSVPVTGLIRAVENHAKNVSLAASLNRDLEVILRRIEREGSTQLLKLAPRIRSLLGLTTTRPLFAGGRFAVIATHWFKPQDQQVVENWMPLIRHANTLGNKNRPAIKWLKESECLINPIGEEEFSRTLESWLADFEPDPERPDPDTNLIKALIFMAGQIEDDRLAAFIGRFCETCYRKVPGWGARSMKLGNACMYALGQMGERGVAELVRVRGRMKYVQARAQLDKALTGAAERAGVSTAELEEIALPDFGLGADGALREALGEVAGEIRIAGSEDVTLRWTGADGKPRKTVPVSVKRDHAGALKALRARLKEIKGLLSGQRHRLESLYLQERSWPCSTWRARYLDHPLLANLARRLIWTVGGTAVIPHSGALVGVDGAAVETPDDAAEVTLWHPLDTDAATVLAWRERLAALEITQPFKQAHREIYVLTDAERETETYSNRFAAHILRQHQFTALCQARGWRYSLQGDWDSHNVPERRLEERDLAILFAVDPVSPDDEDLQTGMGIYQFVSTDRVVFTDNGGSTRDLVDVPSRLFSELMRDVDLFVGVSSIGTDPEWMDRGPDDPALFDYWRSFNASELSETAKTRRAVLESLLPKLKIAGVCELEERHLRVHGMRRVYRIHLGSGNIMMEPNNHYLCIVPGSGKAGRERIRLPFEGDGLLSIILSKAFMLAADDRITDRTILSQIAR